MIDKKKSLPMLVTLGDALEVGHTKWGNEHGHMCVACDWDDQLWSKLILRTGLATYGYDIIEALYFEYPIDEDDDDSEWEYTAHFTTSMTICEYNAITEADPKACMTCVCPSCKAKQH